MGTPALREGEEWVSWPKKGGKCGAGGTHRGSGNGGGGFLDSSDSGGGFQQLRWPKTRGVQRASHECGLGENIGAGNQGIIVDHHPLKDSAAGRKGRGGGSAVGRPWRVWVTCERRWCVGALMCGPCSTVTMCGPCRTVPSGVKLIQMWFNGFKRFQINSNPFKFWPI
jgi:hypothetical protein